MARPISPTPVLEGEDAKNFLALTRAEEKKPSQKKAQFLQDCYMTYLKYKK